MHGLWCMPMLVSGGFTLTCLEHIYIARPCSLFLVEFISPVSFVHRPICDMTLTRKLSVEFLAWFWLQRGSWWRGGVGSDDAAAAADDAAAAAVDDAAAAAAAAATAAAAAADDDDGDDEDEEE